MSLFDLERVKQNGLNLAEIQNQSVELCQAAIKQNPRALLFVNQQIKQNRSMYAMLCLEAIKLVSTSLKYVEKDKVSPETYEILCQNAVKGNPNALLFVDSSLIRDFIYREICFEAVKKNGYMLKCTNLDKYIIDECCYPKLCYTAIKNNPFSIKYIEKERLQNEQYNELCIMAIDKHAECLEHIQNPSYEQCMLAVKQQGAAIYLIKETINFSKEATFELCKCAIMNDYRTIHCMKEMIPKLGEKAYEELCLFAVKINGKSLEYIQNITIELCIAATQNNREAMAYVPDKIKTIIETNIKMEPIDIIEGFVQV